MKQILDLICARGAASRPSASARRIALVAAAVVLALPLLISTTVPAAAEADKTLKLFFAHTGERATITFKRGGKFDAKGLEQINHFLRDWRKNEPARMDPRLLDLVWEVYQRSGASGYINIVSAYRSPATNKMLRGRSRSSGVAKNSQHTLGKAMDFFIPGVKLAQLRALAMQMQVGGVGYYPTSGSPFVHLDVGNVRAWPRMSRTELAGIFPNGNTMHLPSNGKPLPGYAQAAADYKRRVRPKSIEIASTAYQGLESSTSSALLTAMLPTPKSRVQDALNRQTISNAAVQANTSGSFADLVALPVPIPTMRPPESAELTDVETAALAILPSPGGGNISQRPLVLELRQSSASIAAFPIGLADGDPEDEPHLREALVAWALSEPGSGNGMTAPMAVNRMFFSATAKGTSKTGMTSSTVATKEFDLGRFGPDQ